MENKRKAALAQAAGANDGDDRASKRRKMPADSEYDLLQGETRESTTHYGHQFLVQIRKTTDKSGRKVATYFEELLPRKGNEDYYAQIRMPISLQTVEKKLDNLEFSTLSELESYIKRMVANAKDFYNRGSEVYEDSERVRKALSNYMVKTNPAYKLIQGYSAVPTPIPEDLPADTDAEAGSEPPTEASPTAKGEADGERVDEAQADSDADAANEVASDAEEDADGEGEDDEANSDEDGEGEDGSDSEMVSSKRRGSGRAAKKSENDYEGVDYKGLTFQQAQEKIIDEMLRKKENEDDDFVQFEPFLNLPPRALKDYYQVIKEPICLKKLQKLVRGIHCRRDKPGKSDYKSWAAFEEKVSLLWKNALFYNEDGSEIAILAKEMESFFQAQLKEAKAVVPEPPQPRLKLKVGGKEASGTPLPKKITIHVAPGTTSAVDSSAPATSQSAGSISSPAGAAGSGAGALSATTPLTVNQNPDKAQSGSLPGQSPAPLSTAGKPEPVALASRAASSTPGALSTSLSVANGHPPPATVQPMAVPQSISQPPAPVNPVSLYDLRYRQAGRGLADALITQLLIRTHPHLRVEPRFEFTLPADAKAAQQTVSITLPASHGRVQIIASISPSLIDGRRPYKLYVTVNGQVLQRVVPPPLPNDQIGKCQFVFDANLYTGINKITLQIIAAVPKDVKLPNGADAEFEMITVQANLVRH